MAVRLHIQNNLQVVIPIRFAQRAVTGGPVIDAPELDDRGYEMARPGGLNPTNCRGSMFGMMVGDTLRVKIVREELDDAAPLFVEAEPTSAPQFAIVSPAAGTPLAADGIIAVRATDDTLVGQKLIIRFAASDGPIIAEAEPHIFNPRTFAVTPHVCTIHQGAAPSGGVRPSIVGAPLDLDAIFDQIRAIWRPVGVDFNVGAPIEEVFFGFSQNDLAFLTEGTAPGTLGQITSTNFVPNTCNIYFIRFLDSAAGIGVNRENRPIMRWTNPAIVVAVEGSRNPATGLIVLRQGGGTSVLQQVCNSTGHEIGHFLTLAHADLENAPGRTDLYCRRQLMNPRNPLTPAAVPLKNAADNSDVRFDDVGYGIAAVINGETRAHRGCLITLKNFATHATDSETVTVRRRFSSPNLF